MVNDLFDPNRVAYPDDIFNILEALEGVSNDFTTPLDNSSSGVTKELVEAEHETFSPRNKRQKVSGDEGCENFDGQGDQASIIGGVIDYITELQQVLQSLEAKKQRKVYSDYVLSPRLISSPRTTLPLSPRKPPLSPMPISLPISPRTPQSASPYRHRLPSATSYLNTRPASPCNSSSNSDTVNDLVANSKSSIADVEVKFSGANLLLKTLSPRLPGQVTKIISVLEDLSLEILQATINTADERMVNTFTIKIGIECKLSAEDLAQHIQLTFC
ncbi:hypothetical protein Tco_0767425 [Tanacetum coccineum]